MTLSGLWASGPVIPRFRVSVYIYEQGGRGLAIRRCYVLGAHLQVLEKGTPPHSSLPSRPAVGYHRGPEEQLDAGRVPGRGAWSLGEELGLLAVALSG